MTSNQTITKDNAVNKARWGWYLYDFGNSAYAAVVLLAVYSAYFKNGVVGGAEGSRLWGISIGIAMLTVAVISPFLGTLADYAGIKKKFLFFFTTIACVFTALLFFIQKGDVFTGMLFFILAEIGYRSSQVFYNALLPDIAQPDEMGKVGGNGWAIGSAGGIVCLLIALALIQLIGGEFIIRSTFLITAVFFAISATPLFLWLKEKKNTNKLPDGTNYFSFALDRLKATFKEIKHFRELVKFIISFLIYNDGIIMTLDFAAIIGAVLYGLTQQQLIIFMIIVQFTSVAGAYIFGILQDRMSSKYSLVIALIIMIASVVALLFNKTLTGFFIIGGVAGFALTGVQSVSRTFVGMLSPRNKTAEFYGFFALAGRSSSFIGPTVYGIIAAEFALYYQKAGLSEILAEQSGQKVAIGSIIVFLVIGFFLLMLVNEKKGKEASKIY